MRAISAYAGNLHYCGAPLQPNHPVILYLGGLSLKDGERPSRLVDAFACGLDESLTPVSRPNS